MKRFRHIMILMLVSGICACTADQANAPSAGERQFSAPKGSSHTVYGGFAGSQYAIDFMGDSLDTYDQKLRGAQLMAAAGVRFARITAYWYLLQQGSDNTFTPWELSKVHETVTALENAGITPYITLEASACFAVSQTFPCTDVYYAPDTEAHWQAWTTYVQQMVQEFPEIHYWGIWNEPNSDFLRIRPGETRLSLYGKLVERAAPAIHAAGDLVIGPDLGDGSDTTSGLNAHQWAASFMSTHGSYIDILAVHHYSGLSTLQSDMSYYASLISGGDKDLWLTEVGIGYPGATELERAQDLAGVYRLRNSGVVPYWSKAFYFNAGMNADRFGLVENLGSLSPRLRPAYDSLKAIASQSSDLQATIRGPFTVTPNEEWTWSVVPTGGQSPYTYVWRVNGVEMRRDAYSTFAYTNDGNDFLINVSVYDALGHTTGTSIGVTVQSNCTPDCW